MRNLLESETPQPKGMNDNNIYIQCFSSVLFWNVIIAISSYRKVGVGGGAAESRRRMAAESDKGYDSVHTRCVGGNLE